MSWFGLNASTETAIKIMCCLMPYGCIVNSNLLCDYIGLQRGKLFKFTAKLREGGFIESVKGGMNGGYIIARDPKHISLYDMAVCMESDLSAFTETREDMVYAALTAQARESYISALKSTSISDMYEKAQKCRLPGKEQT